MPEWMQPLHSPLHLTPWQSIFGTSCYVVLRNIDNGVIRTAERAFLIRDAGDSQPAACSEPQVVRGRRAVRVVGRDFQNELGRAFFGRCHSGISIQPGCGVTGLCRDSEADTVDPVSLPYFACAVKLFSHCLTEQSVPRFDGREFMIVCIGCKHGSGVNYSRCSFNKGKTDP